jgi:hypothetical protein
MIRGAKPIRAKQRKMQGEDRTGYDRKGPGHFRCDLYLNSKIRFGFRQGLFAEVWEKSGRGAHDAWRVAGKTDGLRRCGAENSGDRLAGAYGNRTHWRISSIRPLVLKTRARTSGANAPSTSQMPDCRLRCGISSPLEYSAEPARQNGPGILGRGGELSTAARVFAGWGYVVCEASVRWILW